MAKTSEIDAIGVTRKHRWASVDKQTAALEADGCRRILSLDAIEREQLAAMMRERTVIKVLFAFLIADQRKRGVGRMLADYSKFAEHLAKLPRGCRGVIKEVDSGFTAETAADRRVMLAHVEKQIRAHFKGAKSAKNLPRGGQPREFTAEQVEQAKLIWENVKRYPTWEVAQEAMPKGFTKWRANRLFGKRK